MKRKRAVVTGTEIANALAVTLISRSKWFEFTPLPDDEYEFIVKDEPGLPLIHWDFQPLAQRSGAS